MTLAGKYALVTGGSGGIGRAIAVALDRAGARVAITYHRHRRAAEETVALLSGNDGPAPVLRLNLADRAATDCVFDELAGSWGRLDVLVNSAVTAPLRAVLELPLRHWEHVLHANVTAFVHCVRRAVPLMTSDSGHIIAISSLGARTCAPGYGALGVAKAGLEALARYLAVELAPRNINVNVVCPGTVRTRALHAFRRVVPDVDEYTASLAERTPDGRLVTPEEVAAVVAFLCGPEARPIRGQTIVIDGGFSLMMAT